MLKDVKLVMDVYCYVSHQFSVTESRPNNDKDHLGSEGSPKLYGFHSKCFAGPKNHMVQ